MLASCFFGPDPEASGRDDTSDTCNGGSSNADNAIISLLQIAIRYEKPLPHQ
jgi:hypothetical protein